MEGEPQSKPIRKGLADDVDPGKAVSVLGEMILSNWAHAISILPTPLTRHEQVMCTANSFPHPYSILTSQAHLSGPGWEQKQGEGRKAQNRLRDRLGVSITIHKAMFWSHLSRAKSRNKHEIMATLS